MFNAVNDRDVEVLRSLVPADRFYVGDAINPDYAHDELSGAHRMPDVLIEAVTTEEVSAVMRYANERRIPVTVRGSGTGLVGAAVPIHGGIMISLAKMNKIVELDENNLTLTVEPGVLLMEISSFVEERGLFYPPDPGEKTATIGGNISTNAGGMRAVKYGVTRDFVRGLTVVLASGEVVELGGKVVKNSSGYALKDLVVGSEGTLAVITRATLKLLPLPMRSISLLIPFTDIMSAIETVPMIMQTKTTPTAVEFMEREVILDAEKHLGKLFPDKSSGAYLLLTYDGRTRAEIEACFAELAAICFDNGGLDLLIIDTDERKESVWPARSAFLEAIKASTTEMDECDVVVPKNRVADYLAFTYTLREKHDIRIKSFGHAGDGNLHIYILRDELDEETFHAKLNAVFDELYAKAEEFGGKVSGEHGIGLAKLPYLKRVTSPSVWEIMRGIKAVFDPNGILNPGKVVD